MAGRQSKLLTRREFGAALTATAVYCIRTHLPRFRPSPWRRRRTMQPLTHLSFVSIVAIACWACAGRTGRSASCDPVFSEFSLAGELVYTADELLNSCASRRQRRASLARPAPGGLRTHRPVSRNRKQIARRCDATHTIRPNSGDWRPAEAVLVTVDRASDAGRRVSPSSLPHDRLPYPRRRPDPGRRAVADEDDLDGARR